MPAANLNIVVTQRRMLTKSEAAAYCGLPVRVFDRDCPVGPNIMAKGYARWDIRELDGWIDRDRAGGDGNETDDDIVGKLQ